MTGFFQAVEISKSFPGVRANDGISLSIDAGEIHALLGENGSGKSTLVKTIHGNIRPDSGTMQLEGGPYAPQSPNAARSRGVAMVFQHFSLFDAMTVAENIALGLEDPPKPSELAELVAATGDRYGLPLNPHAIAGELSVGERQRIEIIRCLLQNPKLLIMDEPTSVLTPQEVDILLATLVQLASEGTTILYITHKLEEVRNLCHQATILRAGRVVATCDPQTKSARELAEMMVGSSFMVPERSGAALGSPLLEINGMSTKPASMFGVGLKNVSLAVREGEILGIAGIAGNGQEELVSALSGEISVSAGEIQVGGTPVTKKSTSVRRRHGLLVAPEERVGHAAAPGMSLTENAYMTASERKRLTRFGIVDWPETRRYAESVISQFDVRTGGAASAAESLSGGNLQKFVVGREILQNPTVLVVNQPTWGVDAAAAAFIRQSLLDLAASGAAVLVVSQDLDELLEISTSIAVLHDGELSHAQSISEVTRNDLGMLMGGAHGMRQAQDGTHVPA